MGELISDYRGYDFRALWVGREKVTEVEQGLLREAIGRADRRRILDLGSGFGRLLGPLLEMGEEVVATDFDSESLSRIGPGAQGKRPTLRVAVNLYHLPFADGAFTGATMIRVSHHLEDPVAALREVARVLRGGARLVVSFNPRPSIGTLVNDIQRAIHRSPEGEFRSLTFSRDPEVDLPPDPFPVFVRPRQRFWSDVKEAGLAKQAEMVSGIEEYYLMKYLPTPLFVRIADVFGEAPGFPTRLAILGVPKNSTEELPPIESVMVCPRCKAPLRFDGDRSPVCPECSFTGGVHEGVIDLRYLPTGARRLGQGLYGG